MKNSQQDKIDTLRTALGTILDCVDYTNGSCRPTEMVAAALPELALKMGRVALEVSGKNK